MADPKKIQNTALKVTNWVGSPASVIVHTLLFAGSFLAGARLLGSGVVEEKSETAQVIDVEYEVVKEKKP